MKYIAFSFVFVALSLCSCSKKQAVVIQTPDAQVQDTLKTITEEMAYEGVNNYCHSTYDWSIAKDNPEIMYVQMGEETDSAYQVVFRSYTGAQVRFYVDKASGKTRLVEHVPALDVDSAADTINLLDYID